jgi:hypothetical protein
MNLLYIQQWAGIRPVLAQEYRYPEQLVYITVSGVWLYIEDLTAKIYP